MAKNTFKRKRGIAQPALRERTWKFISIIIGDDKQAGFIPQHKIEYWNNEVNVSMRCIDAPEGVPPIITQDGNLTTWRTGPIAITWEIVGRAVDQKIYLASRPENGEVRFSLRSKGIEFAYQPHDCPEGERPENVKGSYALYHATKSHCGIPRKTYRALQRKLRKFNVTAADLTVELCEEFQIYNYQAGKVDHWFRRNVIDANGVTRLVDMELSTDGMMLTYKLPDGVVYPAVID